MHLYIENEFLDIQLIDFTPKNSYKWGFSAIFMHIWSTFWISIKSSIIVIIFLIYWIPIN